MRKRWGTFFGGVFGTGAEVTNIKTFLLEIEDKVYGGIIMGDLLFYEVDKKNSLEKKIGTANYTFALWYNNSWWTISRILSLHHQPVKI